jgi:peptidyl-prolyl cis-trans isomerase D
MFDFIRNNRRFLQFVMLVMILPSFVFFGIQGYNRMGDGDNLASIGQQNISQAEFDNTMRGQLDRYKQMLGGNFDAKQFDTPDARENVLNSLIAQKVVGLEAQRSHLMGSDDKLRDMIKTMPGVVNDGKYDAEAYKRVAASQGFSSTDGYEAKLRTDTGVQALSATLQSGTTVPNALSNALAIAQERSYSVQELLFKPETYADKVKFEPADIEKFYKEKIKQFEVAERAKVEYVVFDTASVAKGITVSDTDLKAYYEQNKNRLGQPEERQASHILIKTEAKASDKDVADAKAKATALYEQAKKDPAQFAKLAKENSQDPGSGAQGGDLGFFKREAMVKPFSDAAFGMKDGEISAPVKSDFGWHVIRLTGIKAANVKSYDAAKNELEAELKTQQASKKFAEQTEQFSNLVYEQGDNFKAVAEKFKLEIKTIDGVNRASMKQTAPVGAPNANPFNEKLANLLFADDAVKVKKNSEAVEVAKGRLVSARIVDYVAPKTLPLADVKSTVEAQLRQDLARKMAQTEGEAKLKALQAKPNDTVDGLAAAKDVSKVKPDNLSAAALVAVIRASGQPLPAWAGATLNNGQYAVYKVLALGAAPVLDDTKKQAAQNALKRAYAEQETQSIIAVLRDRHNVKLLKKPSAADASRPTHSGF